MKEETMHLLQNCFSDARKRKKTPTNPHPKTFTESQNQRNIYLGRDIQIITPLLKQSDLQQAVLNQLGFEYLHGWTLHVSRQPNTMFDHPHCKYSSFSKPFLAENSSTIWPSFAFKSEVMTFIKYQSTSSENNIKGTFLNMSNQKAYLKGDLQIQSKDDLPHNPFRQSHISHQQHTFPLPHLYCCVYVKYVFSYFRKCDTCYFTNF